MRARTEADVGSDRDVVPLMEPLRRYALSRTDDPHDADDIVQETLIRVLCARRDLEPGSLLAYAIVIARNLVNSDDRAAQRARRMAPRVVDLRQPERPDETVVDREERAALAEALAALPPDQRESLVAHAVHDVPVTSLASSAGTSPGALAAQLARTRARLRVDYLLALRRADLPTVRCRPVLLALSLGDRRRQETLRVGSHLLTCRVCAELSEPLLERRRALAGLLPWLPVGALLERLKGALSRPAVQAASVAAGVVTVALLVADPWDRSGGPAVPGSAPGPAPAGSAPGPAPEAPAVPGQESAPEVGICPTVSSGADLAPGRTARCERGLVLEVPADEGFWVQGGPDARVWVQLIGTGESAVWVRPGQRVSFVGQVVGHGPDYPGQVGLEPAEGAAHLRGQRAHVEIAATELALVVPTP